MRHFACDCGLTAAIEDIVADAQPALLALRQEMAEEDAGHTLALKAACDQRDTARGDFERAELARARAEVARDAAEALAAHLPERWYSCETMDAVRKERDAALRELADANASIAHAAEAYSAAIRERNIAQADTARLDKAIAVLAKFLEARTRERKAEREGGPRA